MKKFIIRTLCIASPLLLGWILLEVLYRFVPSNYTAKYDGLQMHKETSVYILGNSHAFYGIDPALMTAKAYNASNISQNLLCDKLIFEKYIAYNPNTKAIVLTIDNFSFNEGEADVEFLWRRYFYQSYLCLDIPGISPIDPKSYSLALAPRLSISYESLKLYLDKGALAQCDINGAGHNKGVDKNSNNKEIAKLVADKHATANEPMQPNIQLLKDIITLANKNNIRVIIVTMPVTSYYSKFTDAEKMKTIDGICRQMTKHTNVSYLNLFKDKHFNNDDFYDPDHLNDDGAKKCTAIINTALEKVISKPEN